MPTPSRRSGIVLAGCLMTAGCTLLNFELSGGGHVYSPPTPAVKAFDGTLTTTYTTWLEFDRGLTIAVDNMLAQIQSGNQDIIQEANRYFQVGFEVLQSKDGLSFQPPAVTANMKFHELFVTTLESEWSYSRDWPASGIPGLLRYPEPVQPIRWRARITNASLTFNSSRPRIVDISATLELEVQRQVATGKWIGAAIDLPKAGVFQNDLKDRVTRAYDEYLRKRFGVDTSSAKFKGIRPLSATQK
jgi:hypothetical protein